VNYTPTAYIVHRSQAAIALTFLFASFIYSQQVLRSYDSRFRPTNRSACIYQNPGCHEIVGGEVAVILQIDTDAKFWSIQEKRTQSDGQLLIIATRYRPGIHVATKPTAFVPIIEALEKLHALGYVHGDIRAFNTVFPDTSGEPGCLIDFDFGGRAEQAVYPMGYRAALIDGFRVGEGGEKICIWHDWYALGKLIFSIHQLKYPTDSDQNDPNRQMFDKMKDDWTDELNEDPSQEEIDKLKKFLNDVEGQEWTVATCTPFKNLLAKIEARAAYQNMTALTATGSPLK
jgi:hypothetical protein